MDTVDAAAMLVTARTQLAMSQQHLAMAAGVSRSTVQRAERGVGISAENARSICAVLNLDMAGHIASPDEPLPPVARPGGVTARLRYRFVGDLVVGLTMALGSVLVFGPKVQVGFAKIGMASPALQGWAETLLPVFLAALMVTLPFAVSHDERMATSGPATSMPASNMLVALLLTGSGGLMFLSIIMPMLVTL